VLSYVVRRFLWMVPTLFGVSVIVFLLLRLAPGDPAELVSGDPGMQTVTEDASEALARFRARHLLDQPLWKQYLHYLGPFDLGPQGHRWLGGDGTRPWHGLLAGDLGTEFRRPTVPISHELGRRLAVTLPITLLAVLLSYLVAVPLGVLSAVRRGTALDVGSTLLLFVLYAIPVFWGGLLLQLAFGATGLRWLPVLGLHGPEAAELEGIAWWRDFAAHLVLPVVCYTYGSFAYLSRQMRASVLEAIGQDYVRTARAKGLTERAVVLKHVLRNSLIPVLTLFASVLPTLIGGSVIVEVVFDVPGMGRWAWEALQRREYDVIMATVLFASLSTMVGVLLSDLAYAWADPRIRHG